MTGIYAGTAPTSRRKSQSAFMRGFIDDCITQYAPRTRRGKSQSAFMRGFIDDPPTRTTIVIDRQSQSAFMRGFIDDPRRPRSRSS